MQFSLYVIIPVFFISCSDKIEKHASNDDVVSTRNNQLKIESPQFKREIMGEWHQINRECNEVGRDCVVLSEPILWSFKENDVVWGRYTHPYRIANDTLFIGGMPHIIALNLGDTILLHSLNTNDFMQLVRKKVK